MKNPVRAALLSVALVLVLSSCSPEQVTQAQALLKLFGADLIQTVCQLPLP